uniref:F-box domain-containing protein n=1 Tax=Marseillevirus LCMAC103 TaxID=2506604 RepID=A0A481YTT0_9VIRU|nr:MAG: hypothetical protein LCMAC103_00520 [Marseillevirus LCMAC103]
MEVAPARLADLPRDLQTVVLRFFLLHEVLLFGRVCTSLREAAHKTLECTTEVVLPAAGDVPGGAARTRTELSVAAAWCSRLRTLDFRAADAISLATFRQATAASRRSLERILYGPVAVPGGGGALVLDRSFASLRVLCISAAVSDYLLCALGAYRTLEALELGDVSHDADYAHEHLHTVLQRNPGLQIVHLVSHPDLKFLAACSLPRLTALAVPYMRIRPPLENVEQLRRYGPQLTSLNFGESNVDLDIVRAVAACCPALRRLSFALAGADAGPALDCLESPGFLPQLRHLGCRSAAGVDADRASTYADRLAGSRPDCRVFDYAVSRVAPRWCAPVFGIAALAAELEL